MSDTTPMMVSPTQRLGIFAVDRREPLPLPVAEKAAMCLLDALGLAALARNEATVQALRDIASPVHDTCLGARVWGVNKRVSLSEAVTVNAAAVHALFQDDNDVPSWSHPASLVTPVAVTSGESVDASLSDVLRSLAVGYAAMTWLGAEERVARALIQRGIRTSPTLGTIAAAAAGSSILGLSEVQAANAIGIASSITGGLLEPVRSGSDEWRLQNAHAARGGLLAAQLARTGMQGAVQGLDGPKGLMRAYAGLDHVPEWSHNPKLESILAVWAKPWATLGDNVSAVAAASALRDSGVNPADILEMKVTIWRHYAEYPGTGYAGPFDSVAQALASTAFGVSAMLALGELDYSVSVKRRKDPNILRLVHCVTVEPHDGEWHEATIEAKLRDGRIVQRTCADGPRELMFHQPQTAVALFEDRLRVSGSRPGVGAALAAQVFEVAQGHAQMSIRKLVDMMELA